MISWSLLYLVSEWVVRLIMLVVVVSQRRTPVSAMAWLLVISFMPWPGLVLYLLVGDNRLPRRRVEQHRDVLRQLERRDGRLIHHARLHETGGNPEREGLVALAEQLCDMPAVAGNEAQLIGETGAFVDQLIADIDAATRHVHLEFYIFANDATGKRVADALIKASGRGVACRVLSDAVGARRMLRKLAPRMRQGGVEVHAALPASLLRLSVARLDLRNHRKLAVIDGRIAYAGSQNMVDDDYGRRNLVWRDVMLRLRGPIVHNLQAIFLADWYSESDVVLDSPDLFATPGAPGRTVLQALPSGPNYPTESYQRMVVAALYTARKRVIITTPYLVPDEATMQAIQVAVLRGVEMDIIVPRRSDQKLVGAASRAYYDPLMEMGVRVHLYEEGLLHAKTISIDDTIAFIGSSNFDIRSFTLNFELNLALYGPEITEELRAFQQAYLKDATSLDLAAWRHRPFIKQFTHRVAALLSPVL